MALVLISHDLGVVAETCDRVAVMYAGRIVEEAPARTLFARRAIPTRAGCSPRCRRSADRAPRGSSRSRAWCPTREHAARLCLRAALSAGRRGLRVIGPAAARSAQGAASPVSRRTLLVHAPLRAPHDRSARRRRDLSRTYRAMRGLFGATPDVRAVESRQLRHRAGETLGVVGESGSGKSTLGRIVLGLEPPDQGSVRFDGKPMPASAAGMARAACRNADDLPGSAGRPRSAPAGAVAGRASRSTSTASACRRERSSVRVDLLTQRRPVARAGGAYPARALGGQRQRVVLARALATSPTFLVCDEPVSRSTSRSRRRSSTCWSISRRGSPSLCCSSAMTCAWSADQRPRSP